MQTGIVLLKSRAFLRPFIELYKEHTCLWKYKDPQYRDNVARAKAIKNLLNFTRKYLPEASVNDVKRKIASLRCCYRKENRKVRSSLNGYYPKLWYFELLNFLTESQDNILNETDIKVERLDEEFDESLNNTDDDVTFFEVIKADENIQETKTITNMNKMNRDIDECDIIGLNVGHKLRSMNEKQRLFAEECINNILIKGLLNELNRDTSRALEP